MTKKTKPKLPNHLKQITLGWVKDNFDVDENRKTVKVETPHQEIYSLLDDDTYDFEKWIDTINESFELVKITYEQRYNTTVPDDALKKIVIDTEYDWGVMLLPPRLFAFFINLHVLKRITKHTPEYLTVKNRI